MPDLPPVRPIIARLERMAKAAPGAAHLTREEVLVLGILAAERDGTRAFTAHRPDCRVVTERIQYNQRCTCGLAQGEAQGAWLRRALDELQGRPPPERGGKH